MSGAWVLVIPVKPADAAKSRLRASPAGPGLGLPAAGFPAAPGVADDAAHAALARAIALDTIAAAAECGELARLIVVTADPALGEALPAAPLLPRGVELVLESAPRGIDRAIALALDALALPAPPETSRSARDLPLGTASSGRARQQGEVSAGEAPRAALLGDLPALRPGELAQALRLASRHDRAVVADAEGTGTTLVTAAPGIRLRTAFGEDSLARHTLLGAHPLSPAELPAPSLRRDVDTLAQLRALAGALGPRTAALAR